MQKRINKKIFVQFALFISSILLPFFISAYQPITSFNPFFSNEKLISVYKYSTLQVSKIDSTYFNTNEISHLNDVRTVFTVIWTILIINIIFLFYNKKRLTEDSMYYWKKNIIITTIVSTILVLFVLFDFHNVFILFHQILFPQGNWSFDSSSSNLINLFPEQIFVSFFNYYVIIFVLSILIVTFEIVLWKKILKIKRS
jgi:integral membrane protein (TIGR01906 family)